MPAKRAPSPTMKQPATQRLERASAPPLSSLSNIPNTITRMPPSRRKHPNMSEAAFAVRFLTRRVQFNSQCSAMYRRTSSAESNHDQGPRVTTHGNHCASVDSMNKRSNFDATGGKAECTTNPVGPQGSRKGSVTKSGKPVSTHTHELKTPELCCFNQFLVLQIIRCQ